MHFVRSFVTLKIKFHISVAVLTTSCLSVTKQIREATSQDWMYSNRVTSEDAVLLLCMTV